MNTGSDSSGIAPGRTRDHKGSRRRRLAATAKVRARRVETALDKMRARAADALAPDPDVVLAHHEAVRDAEREVRELDATGRVFSRRDTGAQVRMRDTGALAGRSDRYEVECLTHQGDPLFFDDAAAASRAAKESDVWCEGCRQLAMSPYSVRNRMRKRLAGIKGGRAARPA
ncbi:hypothetical protein [Streptomyces sp. NBC_01304]|uniref:hypothetical protein n=1 Tax=Streptomyces sp. NBC_01304 TaxID=2903818 RepID=UPI002E142948|nr:hypothetical protein OG430_21780 [Streptomyces sp. NBC_01304]